MKQMLLGLTCFALATFYGKKLNAQFSPTYDKAYAMGKGIWEMAPVFTINDFVGGGYNSKGIGVAGVRLGMGLSNNFDLKLRYERLFSFEGQGGGINILQLEPKISFAEQKMAFRLPLQLWFEEGSEFIINPQIMYTFRNASKTFDLTPAFRVDMNFDDNEVYANYGITLGAGFSKDLSKWAIRPEVGYSVDPQTDGGGLLFYGLAASFYFSGKVAAKK
jgi:hypothetical protein